MRIKIEDITPKRAAELLELNTRNRTLNAGRISFYADQMRRGQWTLTHQGISVSPKVLNDGQHRLRAVITSGCTVKMVVAYEDNDDNFAKIDTGKPRSAGDVFSIEGVKNASSVSAGVNKYLKLVNGLQSGDGAKYRVKISNQDIVEMYNSNPDFFQKLFRHAKVCYQKLRIYSIADVVASMAYLNQNKEYTLENIFKFFSQLHGVEETQNRHIKRLRDIIFRDALKSTKLTHTLKMSFLKKTWNAYAMNTPGDNNVLIVSRREKVVFE